MNLPAKLIPTPPPLSQHSRRTAHSAAAEFYNRGRRTNDNGR